MRVNIKIEGLDEIRKAFEKANKKMGDAMVIAIEKGMDIARTSIKSKTPIKTGALRESVKAKIDGKGTNYIVAHIGVIDCTKDEAIKANSVEYGHAAPNDAGGIKVVPPKPFIRTGLKEAKGEIKAIIKSELEKSLR